MFCTKCGAVVDEKTGVCPNCGACERAEEKAEKPDSKKKLHLGKATKTAKSYAVIFSAFMVFPAMICTPAINSGRAMSSALSPLRGCFSFCPFCA